MKYIFLLFLMGAFFSSCKKQTENIKVIAVSSNYNCITPELIDNVWYKSGIKAPLFKGLSGIHFPIYTASNEAQKYFDLGLMLSYGFNHAEAARSFFEATRQDPKCAMSWWGFAYVLGPNYNGGMEKDNFQRAYQAVTKAKFYATTCSQKEKDLIEALTHRYAKDTLITRAVLDSAYAVAMKKVYNKYPKDVTIATLFVESLMDRHPWDLWKKEGTPQPWTPEIITVLKKCLQAEPKHPGANHFYIHATEMSKNAGDAMASADRLRNLVPGSGHLVHMPSHTYIRVGRYHDGVLANQKAVLVDSTYFDACHAQGVYPIAYYPHNYHFIAACATLSGESKIAIKGAKATANHAYKKLFRQPEWATLQHYYTIPWYVDVKLGKWEAIFKSTKPEADLKYPSVIWHYALGIAFLSKDKTEKAKEHLIAIKKIMMDPNLKNLTIWGINNLYDLCEIASKILEGEINAKEKNYSRSIVLLQQAVEKEDALNYDEPPDWFFSVRHHLGAILIEAGKYKEAVKVYDEDLKNYPYNGWALKGLMTAYEKLGATKEYKKSKERFEIAWKYADIKIMSSRIL